MILWIPKHLISTKSTREARYTSTIIILQGKNTFSTVYHSSSKHGFVRKNWNILMLNFFFNLKLTLLFLSLFRVYHEAFLNEKSRRFGLRLFSKWQYRGNARLFMINKNNLQTWKWSGSIYKRKQTKKQSIAPLLY